MSEVSNMKEIKMDYAEYKAMVDKIKEQQDFIESGFDNILLKQIHEESMLGTSLGDGLFQMYYTKTTFEDVKGDIVESIKTCAEYESYEATIKRLQDRIEYLECSLAEEKEAYKNKTVLDCLLG